MTGDDTKNDGKLDRVKYFKQIREEILENLGIPKDTKPERVMQIIDLRAKLDKINSKKNNPK